MSGDLILCGWRVRSGLAMPELLPWQGDDRPADVEIGFGPIPEPADAPVFVLPYSRLWANGAFLLTMEGVGRFWVEGGRRILVEPAPSLNEAELRAFILGPVLGVLCHQRGLLPVHASAVRIDGRAVLIAGISGAGKSALAAALGARGHTLVADDVVAFSPNNSMVLPAFPQCKLCLDVLRSLALDHVGLVPNRPGQPKFRISAPAGFETVPLSPSAVYILNSVMQGKPNKIKHLPPEMAMAQLDNMIFRRGVGMKIQPRKALFKAIARLAQAATVHVLPVERGLPLTELGRLAERVESHALGLRIP